MNSYLIPEFFAKILLWTIIIEVLLVIILFFSIFAVKILKGYRQKKEEFFRKRIAKGILDYMKGIIPIEEVLTYSGTSSKRLLLKELEVFNQRFAGEDWDKVKKEIAEKYLMNSAKNNVKSRKWIKRAFSAHCFSLNPLLEDQSSILELLKDSNFLVRTLVTPAVIQIPIKEGVIIILKYLGQGFGYARYFYLDALVSAKSPEIFQWIEEVAETSRDKALHLACLEVLSGKMQTVHGNFLMRDIESKDEEVRLAALKVYSRNPQKNSSFVLLNHVNDPCKIVRQEALKGLVHFCTPKTIDALEKALSDDDWNIRFQAANSLKNMGKVGWAVLKKQSSESGKNASEIANFTMQLDW